ncbi:hypothetical protein O181_030189 [Austropuccinia psidii MF-1]|uniref:Uncharacterized protein n=1 Tax=Austropuccinia psidii MF-1 TaxID=1389203 RepID=A0A9Q3CTL2_9BASI|nr:hypothetical protein [Austropuccinia psidii MF-1]
MSSSMPCKSCSGSVHDSDSECSIEYVQTQLPMSPNIPLTTPIASSMSVSGLTIDLVNPTAPTSSTWSLPNISFTPITSNPTNTPMHVSEGSGSTPEISSKANPQSKFPRDFLLNSCWNPVTFQEPFGQSKQPTLNIPSGSQVHVVNGKQIWHLKAKKVTGHHHPYAFKPRTAHASSSGEKIVDDEDENMFPNKSEKNNEPRRDNFMVHEEGTQSNSEFTHPQLPLTQSMLVQSEIRKQRNQARKAHNVEKCASQKEQQRWLKAEIPENVHGMRSAVTSHCLSLIKVRDRDSSSLLTSPSTKEGEIAIPVAGHLGYVPEDVLNEP